MTPRELRQEIIRRHAKLGPNGQLSLCNAEKGAHPGGKVTFRTQATAEQAVAELAALTETLVQTVYKCRHHNHFHMSKQAQKGAA